MSAAWYIQCFQLLELSQERNGTVSFLKGLVLVTIISGYLWNRKKASTSDVVSVIWLCVLSVVEWCFEIGWLENYKVLFIAHAIQCQLHYDRSSAWLAYFAMKKSENSDSLKHWAMIVIPCAETTSTSGSESYRMFHAVGEMSRLQFKSTTITKAALKNTYTGMQFVTVIDRGELLDFKQFEAVTPFALGTGTCQDFCLYFSQALSNNLMRCYLRMLTSDRIIVKAHIVSMVALQAVLFAEGNFTIIPMDLFMTIMVVVDFINSTRLYQNTPDYVVTNMYVASLEMCALMTFISLLLNKCSTNVFFSWFSLIATLVASGQLIKSRDFRHGLSNFNL